MEESTYVIIKLVTILIIALVHNTIPPGAYKISYAKLQENAAGDCLTLSYALLFGFSTRGSAL